jgi:hypothetical protein
MIALAVCAALICLGGNYFVNINKQASLDDHLIQAIKLNDLVSISSLIDRGASPNASDTQSAPTRFRDILMDFARRIRSGERSPHAEQSALLVSLNSWWTGGDTEEHPPSNTKIVKFLLARGANVNYRCTDGDAPIIDASLSGRPEIVQLLIDKGADVNVRDEYGYSALDYSDGRHQHAHIPAIITILKRAGARD